MRDFSCWKIYDGFAEGSGRSEKVWLYNPELQINGLFKFKKDTCTTEHISECIAYHLAEYLCLPCAKFELGTYKEREGSFSYNIITDNRVSSLVEGINYITRFYPEYDAEKFKDMASGKVYSVDMIYEVTKGVFDFKSFLNMLLFDFLIGNSDRHQSNWAVIQGDRKTGFSPLYDNGSSLCSYISDAKVYLGNDRLRWRSLVDTKSRSLIRRTMYDCKRPTHLEMIKYIHEKYYEGSREFAQKICELSPDTITSIVELGAENKLYPDKMQLICNFLNAKVEMLKQVYGY